MGKRIYLNVDHSSGDDGSVIKGLHEIVSIIYASGDQGLITRAEEAVEKLSGSVDGKKAKLEKIVHALELAASKKPIPVKSLDHESAVRIEGKIQGFYDGISILSRPSVEDIANGIVEDSARVQYVLNNYPVEGIKKQTFAAKKIKEAGENSVRYLRANWTSEFEAIRDEYLKANGFVDCNGLLVAIQEFEEGKPAVGNSDLFETVKGKVKAALGRMKGCSEYVYVLGSYTFEGELGEIRDQVGAVIVSQDRTSLSELNRKTGAELKYIAAVMQGINKECEAMKSRGPNPYPNYQPDPFEKFCEKGPGTITLESRDLIFEFKG